MKHWKRAAARLTLAAIVVVASPAVAQTVPHTDAVQEDRGAEKPAAPAKTATTSAPAAHWSDTISYALQFEGSVAFNPENPPSHVNFGQEFSDRANRPLFNQALATIARPVGSGDAFDVGFNLQGLFGSDARYTPTIGLLNGTFKGRHQVIMTQANVVLHAPVSGTGGIDFKIGLAPGAMGFEGTDPSGRPLYTVSYVTNFMVPFQTVGVIATAHLTPKLDIYAGIDAGNEVLPGKSDNNSEPAGYFGIGLNHLMGDRLTVLAMARIGPENSLRILPNANRELRYWNDITVTYKASDRTTFVAEANYIRDDGLDASAFGFAGYVTHKLSDAVTLSGRVETMRDSQGAFVVGFASDTAFTNSIIGRPDQYIIAPPTTYGELTAGLAWKPSSINSKAIAVTVRPEVRYDRSLNGTRPFNDLTKRDQFVFGGDLIVGF
ncbi:outer membrane beta-barrel protein [Sphingomonas sp. RB3P16]|uniref:outer membrane beta-barrel protein n=1 Tax=Parasphingomonas frigoris TaxID=3096163 RepID=UPI002FCB4DFA